MPKTPLPVVKLSTLDKVSTVGEETLFLSAADLDTDPKTVTSSLTTLRQALGFEFAYSTTAAGLADTSTGESFFVYESTAKNFVLGFININGVAQPVLGYDNTQIRLPTQRRITQMAGLLGDDGTDLITLKQGGSLTDALGYVTLEMFGADPTGTVDSTQAVINAFTSGYPIRQQIPGTYLLNSGIVLPEQDLSFVGLGMSKTIFKINHFTDAIRIGSAANQTVKNEHYLSGFKITRNNYASYTGTIGPKHLYLSNSRNAVIERVEETGSIGYGIQFDYSDKVTVRNCYLHDHFGGNTTASGTDGVHFYRSTNITANDNVFENLGDDGLSSGSFDINFPVNNVKWSKNTFINCQSGMKLYSYVDTALVESNIVKGSKQAGVYLTNDKNALAGAYIKNITIKDNQFKDIFSGDETNIEPGPLRIRGWLGSDATFDNIVFEGNLADNVYSGVCFVMESAGQRLSNLYIRGNEFSNQVLGSLNSRPWLRLPAVDANLVIHDNDFTEGSAGILSMDYVVSSSFTAQLSKRGRYRITNNRCSNWNKAVTKNLPGSRCFWLRGDLPDCHIQMSYNVGINQYRSDTSTDSRFIEINRIHPDSSFGNNVGDGQTYFGTNNGAWVGPDKTIPDLANALGPQSGTHKVSSVLRTEVPSLTRYNEYTIVTAGTWDTITGTVSGTSGSRSITVVSSTGLYEGAWIQITGVTGVRRVVNYNAATGLCQLNTALDATVSSAAIVNAPGTYISRSLISTATS